MSEARETEIRALKDLIASDGWQILSGAIRAQWQGEAFVAKVKGAVERVRPEGADESVRELLAQRKAMEAVLVWPEQMRRELEAAVTADAADEPEMVRRA